MGFSALAVMVAVLIVSWIVARWAQRAAYRLLQHSQSFFEPDDVQTHGRSDRMHVKRPYISPLIKKRVAVTQKWRCAVCKQLLGETFEIDHRVPLFRGGHPTHESNQQVLCKRCHLFKSAVSDHA